MESFGLFSFHFAHGVDNSGFVGWLATIMKRELGTGVFVVCGQNSNRGGIFDYWGIPIAMKDEAARILRDLRGHHELAASHREALIVQAHNNSRLAKPVGPFSHAVRCGELVYFSGQAAQDPATGKLVGGGIGVQTRQILNNFRLLLEDLKLTFADVVKVSVFLTSMKDFKAMNEIYAEHFAPPYPARSTVAVKELPLNALIEIEMIAKGRLILDRTANAT
jgi:2-iminobutanoate/2-iminopropanoate deaminase